MLNIDFDCKLVDLNYSFNLKLCMDSFSSLSKKLLSYFFNYFLIMGFGVIIAFGVLFYFINFYIESKIHLEIMQNFEKKFNRDIQTLNNLLVEWVDYDSPVLYFENQYPDFVKKEFTISVKNLNLQLFVSINKDNSIKEIYFFDKEGNFIPVPEEIKDFFYKKNIKNLLKREDAKTGIIKFNNHLLYFAARGVLWFKEDYKISHGTLIFGRVVDEQILSNYREEFNYPIQIIELNEKNQMKEKIEIRQKSLFEDEGFLEIRDFFGKPIFAFKLTFPKTNLKITILVLIIIFFIIVIFVAVGLFLLRKSIDKNIIHRLQKFTKEIQEIKQNPEKIKFVEISSGVDEITILQKEFNEMLSEINKNKEIERIYINLLEKEKEKTTNLLLNILPKSIAEKLTEDQGGIIADEYEASILFADIVNFTGWSKNLDPKELVFQLNELFTQFDFLTEKYKMEKIKTIGDNYMAACGVPEKNEFHADNLIRYGIEMIEKLDEMNQRKNLNIKMRVGINSGKVVAGVIGAKKFIYDVWGDTVNIASKVESYGSPNEIQISENTYQQIKEESLKKKFKKIGKLKLRTGHLVEIYRFQNQNNFFR